MGKLAAEELRKLLSCIRRDARVVVPPMPGYDSGVHLMGDKYLVVATDPCIGVPEEWFGWLLIHYAASDVALSGAKPEFCAINLLAPPKTKLEVFHTIMRQVCGAADELDMAIVRGHTGTYDGLSKILGVCTAYGTVAKESLITPAKAEAGDLILCTKPVGLETLVNFSLTHKVLAHRLLGTKEVEKMPELVKMQSCVRQALLLAKTGVVHAMHDATEGGLVAALNEVAEASKLGFEVQFEKFPVSAGVLTLQENFRLSDEQLLSMSSTGTIIAAVDSEAREKVEAMLVKNDFSGSFLGFFTKEKNRVLVKKGRRMPFPRIADDPYERILSGKV